MLSRLAKAIKRGFRGIGKKGYTLVEVAAVVAVTAGLTAVVLPIAVDKTNEAKKAAAKQDCLKIGGAITGFYNDTGFLPAYDGSTTVTATSLVKYEVLRSGSEAGIVGALHDPINAAAMWTNVGASLGVVDLLEYHLVKDKPGTNEDGYREANFNWKGPYIESLASKRDPWGNNYLVFVKAMHTTTGKGALDTTKKYGWIISAGPNGILETAVTDKDLVNDDIGVMLSAAQAAK